MTEKNSSMEPEEKEDPQDAPEQRPISELPQAEKQEGPVKIHGDKLDAEKSKG
jgi:hypothetical protein